MPGLRQRHLGILMITLLGTILGIMAGFGLGRVMLLRAIRSGLSDYAQQLISHADGLSDELDDLFRHQDASQIPFCSDQEIAALQAETFRAHGLKDIGRTSNGILYCSAFLGHLKNPYKESAPALILANGTHIYINVPVVLASFDGNRATIMENGNTDVVLSPDAFDRCDRPNVRYMISAIDRKKGQSVPIAGAPLGVGAELVLSGDSKRISGSIYQSRCSAIHPLCVVTAERVADVWGRTRPMQIAYAAMGAVAGFGFGLALALLYLRTVALSNQFHRDLIKDSRSLRLVYQPLLDIATRHCVGAEALLRWTDHDGNAVSPETFIAMAEENGFIGEVTALVVRRATRELGDLLRQHRDLTLSINIAAEDLQGDQLIPLLKKHVVNAGILPSQIALELTERSTADVAVIGASMHRLCREGYKVHIDDFGIGYSSLSYLEQLSVDAIKIDRAFTKSIGTNAVIAPVLPQILSLAASLGMEVVVEGVETETQADYLESTGKPLQVQGWLFSKPMSADALAAFWDSSHQQTTSQPAWEPIALTSH